MANEEIVSRIVDIGGIPVRSFRSVDEAASWVLPEDGLLNPGFAVAINAEKVVRAQALPELMRVIRDATLCYADGVAVSWTIAKRGVANTRIPGCDLWEVLMRRAGRMAVPVFLLGAKADVHNATRERLEAECGTWIVGSSDGYFTNDEEVIEKIASSGAQLVTVALGSPRQEQFIHACRKKYPDAFYIGVGGAYDAFVGAVKRAPQWMQHNGLEWLYRLYKQPFRIRRQALLVKYMMLYFNRRL